MNRKDSLYFFSFFSKRHVWAVVGYTFQSTIINFFFATAHMFSTWGKNEMNFKTMSSFRTHSSFPFGVLLKNYVIIASY